LVNVVGVEQPAENATERSQRERDLMARY